MYTCKTEINTGLHQQGSNETKISNILGFVTSNCTMVTS